jgi:YD repeat-containing protein
MKHLIAAALAVMATVSLRADSAETVTYTYDAKGRLVKVVRNGTTNDNVQTQYTYDKANNRKTVTTTGSPNPPQ